MSKVSITYGTQTISEVDETTPVEIKYQGNVIASVSDGDTKTLTCANKYMGSDVTVGSKTVNCSNKIMGSDLVIAAEASGEVWVLKATVGGTVTVVEQGTLNFISNGQKFDTFSYQYGQYSKMSSLYFAFEGTYTTIHAQPAKPPIKVKEGYRTLTFLTPPTGDLLAWLKLWAVKQ